MNKAIILLILLAFGCSQSSDENPNPTNPISLGTPLDFEGEVMSTTEINLIWKLSNIAFEEGFKIERKTGLDNFAVVGENANNKKNFIDKGLTPGTLYIYRVYSYNGATRSTYSNELSLTTTAVLPSVQIGTQFWQPTNLNLTAYSDGTPIPEVTDKTAWVGLTTGAWCYYNNDPANGAIYGKLYNWYAVAGIWNEASKTDISQRKKLVPPGYHIPSDFEWSILIEYLGGGTIAGGKMKETGLAHWNGPNMDATNTSGFTGLPGGYRNESSGNFYEIGDEGIWWSSSNGDGYEWSWRRDLNLNDGQVRRKNFKWFNGYSVRYVKD